MGSLQVGVSIQLIAPASGAPERNRTHHIKWLLVSIQLIAPASGASPGEFDRLAKTIDCFHSTDCPSEWGPRSPGLRTSYDTVSIQLIAPASGAMRSLRVGLIPSSGVSIQLIAPASGAKLIQAEMLSAILGFHSTDCPSEWGQGSGSMNINEIERFHSTDCPSEWGQHISLSPLFCQL